MQASAVTERREESHSKLRALLESRTETLSLLNELVAMRPFKPGPDVQILLQEYCESLVDYTASAHFQLYSYIEEGRERRASVRELAESAYPRIAAATQHILDFNEKYERVDYDNDLANLDDDLSRLGEILASRIQDEDQIIELFTQERS
ncbi:MAG TPA: Rsd/AlgQ family anti-sigma factor [Gammaproteobacteria bacterium]|nr:Rsd/AlgQ family anti-sigma factor [Gammaproteobacteria bacterium]